jgi:serine/threonine protein kinase/alpha-tubulin suppressor-like RCC1 family protein
LQPWFPGLEIVELLGAGGMGAVYKARQPRLNRFVALKILTCPPEHYADFAMRFEREAQVMARLNHPHIVTIFDFGEVDRSAAGMETLFYFLMEFVDGTDLNQLIRTGELKPEEAIEFVPQICEALQFAHDEGITHRDIKPANILVDRKSHVKIADFGLAKLIQGEETLAIGLTMTGTAMGTPQYMAPEQWESPEKVDHRADIYALGVVIYELLTGERPAGVFDPPSKKCGSDKRIDTIVMRAMEKEPDRRYQQAQEINSEVTRLIASAPGLPSMRRRRQNRIGMVAGLVVAVGFGGWFLNQSEDGVADTLSTVEVPVSGKRDPMASGVSFVVDSPSKPGRLRATGTMLNGQALDLSKYAAYDDFVDVASSYNRWVALRSNGETISSDGLADFKNIRRIARGFDGEHCFIDTTGRIRFFRGREMDLPSIVEDSRVVDAACAASHGVAVFENGDAVVFGLYYEEAVGDPSVAEGTGTPRWPQPPASALEKVKSVAAISTHAAALHLDGSVSVWGWNGPITWEPEPKMKPLLQIASAQDAFLMLDADGQVWEFSLPRSGHPDQPVGFNGKVLRLDTQAVRLRDRCWLRKDGTWSGKLVYRPTINLLQAGDLNADANFAMRGGTASTTSGHLLWIDPVKPSALASPPSFTAIKPGHLRATGTFMNGQPLDLSKCTVYDDFVEVVAGSDYWIGLRSNGQLISSDGRADLKDIRRIARSYGGFPCFIDVAGKIRFHRWMEMKLPAALDDAVVLDAACGEEHGVALLESGEAVVFGRRYEEAVGDPSVPGETGTPRWPQPPASALKNVKAVAAISTHTAALHHDGSVSVWGWENELSWEPQDKMKRIVQITSSTDSFRMLDTDGQVWDFPVPRNAHPEQPVRFDGKAYLFDSRSVRLRDQLWLRRNGTWSGLEADRPTMQVLQAGNLTADSVFALRASAINNVPFGYLLWIEPSKPEASIAPFSAPRIAAVEKVRPEVK